MTRLIVFLAFIVAAASGLAWLADHPGQIVMNWEGYEMKISVFHAVVALAMIIGTVLVTWSLLRHLWESPATIGNYFNKRRQKRGLDALSSGIIALGAGDRSTATKYAIQARKSMPNEPLTHLLRAQAAQLSDDRATARRIYESMLGSPDTEQLGLRGLFLEAEREGEMEAAKQFAERAVSLNPSLSWPVDALFDLQCKGRDWAGALQTLATSRKHGHVEKGSAERRRAVLLTAQAQDLEDKDPERALNLALDAHKLAPDLVPAGAIAGRLLASRGSTPKATKVLQQTWQRSPHPDLATAYAYARLGDSPRDRLDRVKKLAQLNPHSLESAIAVANAAIEAKDYGAARDALEPLMESRLTQRACTLMARIESEEYGDKGRVREWLARAVNAPRDPAWTADGIVSEQWAAVSPVTGALDAFTWRVPVESMEKTADEIVARKLEELVALGAPLEVSGEAKDVTPTDARASGVQGGGMEKDADEDAAHAAPDQTAPVQTAPAKPVKEEAVVDADVVDEAPRAEAKPAADEEAAEVTATAPAPKNDNEADAAEIMPAKVGEDHSGGKFEGHTSAAPVAPSAGEPPAGADKGSVAAAGTKTETGTGTSEAEVAGSGSADTAKPKESVSAADAAAEEAAVPMPVRTDSDASAKPGASSGTRETQPKTGAKGEPHRAARAKSGEARIFVSPRAPDDPGPEGEVSDLPSGPMKPFRHGAA